MSAVCSGVNLSFNLVSVTVDLYASVSSDRGGSGLSNLCVGTDKAHAPTAIKQLYRCPECSNEDKDSFAKGRKSGKAWVVVPQSEIDKADETVTKAAGMAFTYHDAKDVDAQMMAVDAPYYVAPASAQFAHVYALLADWLARNDDVALITRFAPRSSEASFRLVARDGLLLLQKLCFPAEMHAAPAVPALTDSKDAGALNEMIRSRVEPFDPTQWVDRRKDILQTYAAEQEPVQQESAVMLDLSSLLKRSTAKPKAARKPRAKSA